MPSNDENIPTEIFDLAEAVTETLPRQASRPQVPGPPAGADPNVGRRVGPYRVERMIARGGMGRVYLAIREDDYEQRVALKLVETGSEKLKVLERFYLERQILAGLQHPNIARILDGGTTEDALPFFVMEYIEGEPVDHYCENHGLSLVQRLVLFRKICAAVQFAHRNLVVHRDLKPGNILVTDDGVPMLLDFGIAKLVDNEPSASETQPGEAPMTPGYASPEQIQGENVTTASDVYSLGVLLYRLVSSQPPFRPETGLAQLVEMVCTVDPPPPSSVAAAGWQRRLRGDLDAIVLKAMSKRPDERYASAWHLAEDVRRHLAGLPVEAHPGTRFERAVKHVRRHKLGWAVVLLVLALAVTSTVLWRRSVIKERQTAAARQQAEDALLRAEMVSDLLEDVFKSADPDAGALSVREVLDQGREQLTGQLEDDPEVRAELLTTLGTVYNNLGLYDEARQLKEEALSNRLASDPSDRSDLAADLNNLGRLAYDLGDYDGARRYLEDAVAMWQRLGDEHGTVVGMRNLAAALTQSGHTDEALGILTEMVAVQRRLPNAKGEDVGKSLYSLGVLHRTRGENAEAEALLRQALDILSEASGRRNTWVAAVLGTLGRVQHARGRHDEARRSLEEALALRLELLGDDHVHVANTRKNLAALLLDLGEVEAAGELLDEASRVLREKKKAGDWTVADVESLRGVYLAALGRYAEAEPLVLDGYRTIRETKGDTDVATVTARQRVLALYESWGQDEKAAAFEAQSSEDAPATRPSGSG